VLRGYVSHQAARDDYGVALNADFSIDAQETEKLRRKSPDSAHAREGGHPAGFPRSRE
jgi:hypothetical protein